MMRDISSGMTQRFDHDNVLIKQVATKNATTGTDVAATRFQSIVVRLYKETNMATQHHGDGRKSELMKRFVDQLDGKTNRAYPNGRVGADDEGELAYAIAADPRHQIIRIEFNKPVDWLGLDRESAESLRDMLTEKLLELRGIKADC